jgi:methylenetetrahydrofolate reductase (NADPH)
MKLTDLWHPARHPTLSFEVYPARTAKAQEKLAATLDELVALQPDFMSVTFGAGGSTRTGSYELVSRLRQQKRQLVLAYFAAYGLSPGQVVEILDSYRELGIENLLAVRGDLPRDQPDYRPHPESFAHASDLLAFLRPRYAFCLGAAGYPEGHIEAPSREADMEYLQLKVAAGAEFIITNYFYDNRFYLDFCDRCRAAGISVPILPGIMPIYSVRLLESLAATCGASIPREVRAGLGRIAEDDTDALASFGVELALRQARELLQKGAPGIHVFTMDRSTAAAEIVRRLRGEGLLQAPRAAP